MEEKNKEVEIDLLELAYKLWDNKKFIIKVSLIGTVVGLVIAFSIPKEYTTTVVFTTNSNDAKAGGMGALASLAGINLGVVGSEDIFSPELYPEVISSTPFIRGLLNIKVFDKTQNIDTTLYSYIKDEQHKAWWNYLFELPKQMLTFIKSTSPSASSEIKRTLFISEEEMSIIEAVRDLYSINTDLKSGITTLEVSAQSPVIAALLADTLTAYLQDYIIKQRTKKAKMNLESSKKLHLKAQNNYYKTQQELATFVDRNKNITRASYRVNQDRLQNEVDLAYTLYNQMSQQVQVNIIKIQNDTPIFVVIQPAVESLYPTSPKKKVIIVFFIFLSIVIGSLQVIRKDMFKILTDKK